MKKWTDDENELLRRKSAEYLGPGAMTDIMADPECQVVFRDRGYGSVKSQRTVLQCAFGNVRPLMLAEGWDREEAHKLLVHFCRHYSDRRLEKILCEKMNRPLEEIRAQRYKHLWLTHEEYVELMDPGAVTPAEKTDLRRAMDEMQQRLTEYEDIIADQDEQFQDLIEHTETALHILRMMKKRSFKLVRARQGQPQGS